MAVRTCGGEAVVEGLGAHGCEYMTGGRVVVLGGVGWNLAAGMSGGELFVWDADGSAAKGLNGDLAGFADMDEAAAERLRGLVQAHLDVTASPLARRLLADWPTALGQFARILPLPELGRQPGRPRASARPATSPPPPGPPLHSTVDVASGRGGRALGCRHALSVGHGRAAASGDQRRETAGLQLAVGRGLLKRILGWATERAGSRTVPHLSSLIDYLTLLGKRRAYHPNNTFKRIPNHWRFGGAKVPCY